MLESSPEKVEQLLRLCFCTNSQKSTLGRTLTSRRPWRVLKDSTWQKAPRVPVARCSFSYSNSNEHPYTQNWRKFACAERYLNA